MLCTEIVSDIQNNFCTQHVLPIFCKKKSFWQRLICTYYTSKCQHLWITYLPCLVNLVKECPLRRVSRGLYLSQMTVIVTQLSAGSRLFYGLDSSKCYYSAAFLGQNSENWVECCEEILFGFHRSCFWCLARDVAAAGLLFWVRNPVHCSVSKYWLLVELTLKIFDWKLLIEEFLQDLKKHCQLFAFCLQNHNSSH